MTHDRGPQNLSQNPSFDCTVLASGRLRHGVVAPPDRSPQRASWRSPRAGTARKRRPGRDDHGIHKLRYRADTESNGSTRGQRTVPPDKRGTHDLHCFHCGCARGRGRGVLGRTAAQRRLGGKRGTAAWGSGPGTRTRAGHGPQGITTTPFGQPLEWRNVTACRPDRPGPARCTPGGALGRNGPPAPAGAGLPCSGRRGARSPTGPSANSGVSPASRRTPLPAKSAVCWQSSAAVAVPGTWRRCGCSTTRTPSRLPAPGGTRTGRTMPTPCCTGRSLVHHRLGDPAAGHHRR